MAVRGPRRGGRPGAAGRSGNTAPKAGGKGRGPAYAEGLYLCTITGQRFGEYQNDKKTPFIGITFKPTHLLDSVHPDDTSKATKVSVAYDRETQMCVTEGTVKAGIFLKQLRAAGWRTKSLADLDPETPGGQDLTGNIVKVRCSHTTKDGKTFEDWSIFTPGGGKKREHRAGVASKLDALFSSDIAAMVEDVPTTDEPEEELGEEEVEEYAAEDVEGGEEDGDESFPF